MFVLNTSRPLFRNNARLRQAVNFAADRRALIREIGPPRGRRPTSTSRRSSPATATSAIYPLTGPDVKKARQLAKGHTRSGKALLYTIANPVGVAQAQIVRNNLRKIGLDVEIKEFPAARPLRQAGDAR